MAGLVPAVSLANLAHVRLLALVNNSPDLLPRSRTNVMAAKSVNLENDGHEK